jgi:hypothetical protein
VLLGLGAAVERDRDQQLARTDQVRRRRPEPVQQQSLVGHPWLDAGRVDARGPACRRTGDPLTQVAQPR